MFVDVQPLIVLLMYKYPITSLQLLLKCSMVHWSCWGVSNIILVLSHYRNPLPGGRLSFDSICNDYFSANDDSLLTWETEDYETSPRAAEIGAPLSEGYSLYRELQHEYR